MQESKVDLCVPAEPAYARSVRMMAANLAVVCGMSVDDVEDVRMAAEEGFVYACGTRPVACDVTFSLADGSMDVSFSLGTSGVDADDVEGREAVHYAELLLSAVCDDYEIDDAAHVLTLSKCTGVAND